MKSQSDPLCNMHPVLDLMISNAPCGTFNVAQQNAYCWPSNTLNNIQCYWAKYILLALKHGLICFLTSIESHTNIKDIWNLSDSDWVQCNLKMSILRDFFFSWRKYIVIEIPLGSIFHEMNSMNINTWNYLTSKDT